TYASEADPKRLTPKRNAFGFRHPAGMDQNPADSAVLVSMTPAPVPTIPGVRSRASGRSSRVARQPPATSGGSKMAYDEDGHTRSISRALAAPVRRAMSRMLNYSPHPTPDSRSGTTRGSGVVDCAFYVNGERQPDQWDYRDAFTAARRTGNGFVWLGLKEPDADELADIADVFELHELPVEDAVKSHQRPKLERYGNMTFVSMRTARYVEHAELTETSEVVESGDVLMFIGDHFIITVRHGDAVRLAPVRADLESKRELLVRGPWAVAYAVYDSVIDGLVEV